MNYPLALKEIADQFGKTLPFRVEPYSKKNWGNPLHSLCSYQGKLKPAMAHWLVREFVPVGGTVLDPIGGVGTIPFEACLLQRSGISNDLSPFASTVASGKIAAPQLSDALLIWEKMWADIELISVTSEDLNYAAFGLNSKVEDYYHPDTLREILRARRLFLSRTDWAPHENTIWASILHILHGNRPYALSRTSHPITPFAPKGEFLYRSMYEKVRERLQRALVDIPTDIKRGKSFFGDFRDLSIDALGQVDAIITSPPFLGMRFDRPNWLRLWFCGWTANHFHERSKLFLERQQIQSSDCYLDLFSKSAELLPRHAPLVIHIGSGSTAKRRLDIELQDRAKDFFRLEAIISEDVTDIEVHGIKDKGLTTHHNLLVFSRC